MKIILHCFCRFHCDCKLLFALVWFESSFSSNNSIKPNYCCQKQVSLWVITFKYLPTLAWWIFQRLGFWRQKMFSSLVFIMIELTMHPMLFQTHLQVWFVSKYCGLIFLTKPTSTHILNYTPKNAYYSISFTGGVVIML